MTKTDILNYATASPWNTNKAVLSDMLDEFALSDNKEEIELSATENKVYTPADGKVYKKVTVDVPVGSGSSELSTAQVAITNNHSEDVVVQGPMISDNVYIDSITLSTSDNASIEVILYNEEMVLYFYTSGNIEFIFTGDIIKEDAESAFVTGDGTITIATGSTSPK